MTNGRRAILVPVLLALTSGITASGQSASTAPASADARAAFVDRLVPAGLRSLGAYETLGRLLAAGPRPTGSTAADRAVALMAEHMRALGFDNVRTEPTVVGQWVRGTVEDGAILSKSEGRITVKVRAIGNSIATPAAGLTAGLLEVHSIPELEAIADQARGRIVFFNGAMDPTKLDTFGAYGGAAAQRSGGAVAAARAGAVGVIVRSLALEINDDPHTGTMQYAADVPKIPAVTISTASAERLSRLLRGDPGTRFTFRTSCETRAPVTSHNVMGELRGAEHPDEIIVIGGHIDSWDLSAGAHDDGAGCAQSIEALRLLRVLGVRPKRTIRAVLYMDEENGGTGGRDYASSPNRAAESHIAAIESDRGGFLPLGMGVGAKGADYDRILSWAPLFQRAGLQWIRPGGGGVDIGPLGTSGTILMGLVPDSQRYFEVHHSGIDTIDRVNARELEFGAIHMALMAHLLSEDFPR
jgi:carboxypeptidase Q